MSTNKRTESARENAEHLRNVIVARVLVNIPWAVLESDQYYKSRPMHSQTLTPVPAHQMPPSISKPFFSFSCTEIWWLLFSILFAPIVGGSAQIRGQDLSFQITVPSSNNHLVQVKATASRGTSSFSFLNSYGARLGLGERIDSFTATNGDVRRVASGEFRSNQPVLNFSYTVRLDQPGNTSDMAHVSWLGEEMGFLMLADLLPGPISHDTVALDFVLPPGWTIVSSIRPTTANRFVVTDPQKLIFCVGDSLREKKKIVGRMELAFVTGSDWSFSDDQALKVAEKIIKHYATRVVPLSERRVVFFLVPYTSKADQEPHWIAETRGSTIAMIFNEGRPAKYALSALGIALAHELFHVWVPNGLSLVGDYDWFFEGFTMYQALRTAVELGFINSEEYLNTIGRVYQSYKSSSGWDDFSLLEASNRRFTGGSAIVYDKGMLVAFLYDLGLRDASGGKSSLDNIYEALFQGAGGQRDANQAIISALNSPSEMKEFTQSYIVENSSVELERLLDRYGLGIESTGSEIRLTVKNELSQRQRSLLRSLKLTH